MQLPAAPWQTDNTFRRNGYKCNISCSTSMCAYVFARSSLSCGQCIGLVGILRRAEKEIGQFPNSTGIWTGWRHVCFTVQISYFAWSSLRRPYYYLAMAFLSPSSGKFLRFSCWHCCNHTTAHTIETDNGWECSDVVANWIAMQVWVEKPTCNDYWN